MLSLAHFSRLSDSPHLRDVEVKVGDDQLMAEKGTNPLLKDTHLDIVNAHTTLLGICRPGRVPKLLLRPEVGGGVLSDDRSISFVPCRSKRV